MPLGRPVTAGTVTCDPRHNGIEQSGEADRQCSSIPLVRVYRAVRPQERPSR